MTRAASAPVSNEVADAVCETLLEEQGSNLVAIVFYGSQLNRTAGPRSDWDFFVVVERYERAHPRRWDAILNRVLPPSIYRRAIPLPSGSTAHCKLSVVSAKDLARYTSLRAPDSYVLGRLSKRVALVYARDAEAREAILRALARSVAACARWTLHEGHGYASVEAFARAAVGFSYRCEERVEGPERADALFEADASHFCAVYRAALDAEEREGGARIDPSTHAIASASANARRERAWAERFIRRSRRRARLRWLKNVATVRDWPDYMLAKLERHQGLRIELGERERRHPLIAAVRHYVRLRREGRIVRHHAARSRDQRTTP